MSKLVMCGNVPIGGNNPISIQSMTNVDPNREDLILEQIDSLKSAGCEIVRLAVPDMKAAETFARVRKKTSIPLVSDIHFDYRLAIASIEAGADKIRINPGNIGTKDRVYKVVEKAKEKNIPIRVGINSGSLESSILKKYGKVTAEGLAESALNNLKIIEDMGYDNLVVSLKSSDVKMNYEAYKLVSKKTNHPLHIGVTEAGTIYKGKVKSAIGLGSLLMSNIGDTMRVSLTADPVEEVIFAKELLEIIGYRKADFDIVSCPTCGRTKVELKNLAEEVENRLKDREDIKGIKVAVMGCVVNGPGEAKEADYGIAGGDGKGIIFKKGKKIKTVNEANLVDELISLIEKDNER